MRGSRKQQKTIRVQTQGHGDVRTVPSLSRQSNADRGKLATGVAKLTHLAYLYHATDKRAPCGASHADPLTAA